MRIARPNLISIVARLSVAALFSAWAFAPGLLIAAQAQQPMPMTDEQNEHEKQMYDILKEAEPLMKEKRFVEARKRLLQAVPLDPTSNSANLHSMLGFADQQVGDLEEAITESQLAMKYQPKMVDLCMNVAMAYKDLGDYGKAKEWIAQYLNSNPEDAQRKREAEEMMKKLGEQESMNGSQSVKAPDYLQGLIAQQGAARWPRESFPLKVFIERSEGIPGVPADSENMLNACFESWNRASGGLLPTVLAPNRKKADIVIRWTNEPNKVTAHDGVHLEQGVTKVMRAVLPGASIGTIRSADIILLTVRRENGETLTPDDMKAVCLHEIGHALGLGGHSANSADTMYFSSSARQLPALSHRDKATIAKLYGGGGPAGQPMQTGYSGQTTMPPFSGQTTMPPFGQSFNAPRFPGNQYGQPQYGQQPSGYQQGSGYPPMQNPYMRPNPYVQNPYMQPNPYVQNQYQQPAPYQQQSQ